MGELRITKKDHWLYDFGVSTYKGMILYRKKCSYCNEVQLDPIYVDIIDSLKEAGLLDKTYKLLCCYCLVLEKTNMMQHVHNVESIDYDKENDILELEIFLWKDIKGFKDLHLTTFRIHDWSKVERWKKCLK